MTVAYATFGSVTEIRLSRSVVLISNDLFTMTRRGAEPCGWADCGGRVVVWVPVGTEDGFCAASAAGDAGAGCCALASDIAATGRRNWHNTAPSSAVENFIVRFFST